jgi:hypothetical protein
VPITPATNCSPIVFSPSAGRIGMMSKIGCVGSTCASARRTSGTTDSGAAVVRTAYIRRSPSACVTGR